MTKAIDCKEIPMQTLEERLAAIDKYYAHEGRTIDLALIPAFAILIPGLAFLCAIGVGIAWRSQGSLWAALLWLPLAAAACVWGNVSWRLGLRLMRRWRGSLEKNF